MQVSVRLADKRADLPAILAAAEAFTARIDMPFLHPSARQPFESAVSDILGLDAVLPYLAETRGRIVGALGLLIAPFPWNPGRLLAEEIFFWCAADAPPTTALCLLRAGFAGARGRSASHLAMHALSSSPAKLHRTVCRLGFEPLQSTYVKAC